MKQYRQAVSALVLKPAGVCSPDGCSTVYSLLLVHKPRRNDCWQLPQGGVEEGESIEQAVLRELKEETGLVFSAVDSVSTQSYCYDFPPGFVQRFHPINDGQRLCFVVIKTDDSAIVTVDNDEIDGFAWILPEQLPKYIERTEYREVIERVMGEWSTKAGKAERAERK